MHVLVCAALFDRKASGICTGRIVRGLLDCGVRVSVVTSNRSELSLRHPLLSMQAYPVEPRDPKALFRLYARMTDGLACAMYLWSRRAGRRDPAERPDLVYGLAWPESSLMAAYRLAERHGLPLWLHLSDAIPPPDGSALPGYAQRDLQRIVDRAAGCTMTNRQTIDYQRGVFRYPHADWAQELPHVAPPPRRLGPRPQARRFLYIGTFSNNRDPRLLLRGFAAYRRRHPAARLCFVVAYPEQVLEPLRELGIDEGVDVHGYSRETERFMREADVLVSIDFKLRVPLASTTKIRDYLSVDRPVFLLGEPGSPDSEFVAPFSDTCVVVSDESPERIAEGLDRSLQVSEDAAAFERRFEAMAAYLAPAIGRRLLGLFERSLSVTAAPSSRP